MKVASLVLCLLPLCNIAESLGEASAISEQVVSGNILSPVNENSPVFEAATEINDVLESLNKNEKLWMFPFKDMMHLKIQDLDYHNRHVFVNAIMHMITESNPDCHEMIQFSFAAGTYELEFVNDTTLVDNIIAYCNDHNIANQINIDEFQTQLLDHKNKALNPIIHAVFQLATEIDIPPATLLLERILRLFSPESLLVSSLENIVDGAKNILLKWHETDIAPRCSNGHYSGILESLSYTIQRAVIEIDECLMRDEVAKILMSAGVEITEIDRQAFLSMITSYADRKRYNFYYEAHIFQTPQIPNSEYLFNNNILAIIYDNLHKIENFETLAFLIKYIGKDGYLAISKEILHDAEKDADTNVSELWFKILHYAEQVGMPPEAIEDIFVQGLDAISYQLPSAL